MLKCDRCKKGNKGRYKSFNLEVGDKTKPVTWCYECLDTPLGSGKTDAQMFEHISTPWWIHAGLKPNAEQKKQLAYLKAHNMSWGDLRKERYANMPKAPAGYDGNRAFQEHYKKYGTKNAPEVRFGKTSKDS